jgi:hypothetical protein
LKELTQRHGDRETRGKVNFLFATEDTEAAENDDDK